MCLQTVNDGDLGKMREVEALAGRLETTYLSQQSPDGERGGERTPEQSPALSGSYPLYTKTGDKVVNYLM